MSHELLPKLQGELTALRARIAQQEAAIAAAAGDAAALDAARQRLGALAGELAKLEHTERMFIEQAHGG